MPHHVTPCSDTYLDPSPADRPAPHDNQKLQLFQCHSTHPDTSGPRAVKPCCRAPAATFTTCFFLVYVKATVGSAGVVVSLC